MDSRCAILARRGRPSVLRPVSGRVELGRLERLRQLLGIELRSLVVLGQRLFHNPNGEPRRVALAREHSNEATHGYIGREFPFAAESPVDQFASRSRLGVVADLLQGLADGVGFDPLTAQLTGEGATCEALTVVPAGHPCPREG